MKFEKLVKKVNEASTDKDKLAFVEELINKGFDKKDIKNKLKKQFDDISNSEIKILINLF